MGEACLHTPKPTQDVHSENGNTSSGGNPSEGLFRAGFAVRKAIAADHNCNQAGDPRNRSSEEGLESGEAGVKGRAADLRESWDGKRQENYNRKCSAAKLFDW